ncbi:glycosyltransferase [Actinocorallia lasiicapitis]
MRIALVGPVFPAKGGVARHTAELAHRLAADGHEVVVESWRAQYPALLYPGVQTITVPEGEPFPVTRHALSWRRPDGWVRAGRRMRGHDLVVCVLVSTVQIPAYLALLAGLGGRTTPVALCHNVLPHEARPFDRPLVRALLRRTDGVLTHSAAQAALSDELAGCPARVAELPPHLPSVGGDRVPGVRGRLLFFGAVRPYKGLDVLLRALPAEIALTVAGEFWNGLAAARSLAGGRAVEFRPGYVPAAKIAGLFDRADALVLPYRAATASQNVALGFAHGVPVIATRVGEFPALIRPGVDGLLADPGDPRSLRAAIEEFYADPGRFRVAPTDPEPLWRRYLAELLQAGR